MELASDDDGARPGAPTEPDVKRLPLLLALVTAGCRARALPESQLFPAGTPFVARYVEIEGTRIRYVDGGGHGVPVIFLHGLGASMYAWRKNLPAVAAAGFRVIAYDNRGFGLSDKPAGPYDNASLAGLTIGLMDSLRLPEAVLIGHSMGGAIAAEVAIDYPARVRGLVLIGSAGLGAREAALLRVARWPLIGPFVLAFRGRRLTARILKSTYADPTKVTEADVDQYYAPVAEPQYARALGGVLRQFRVDGLAGRLDHVAAPTLVLWGEQDRIVPVGLGRAMATEISRSAFLTVQRAGHAVQEEAPDEVNRLVVKFLREGLPRIPADLAFGR